MINTAHLLARIWIKTVENLQIMNGIIYSRYPLACSDDLCGTATIPINIFVRKKGN